MDQIKTQVHKTGIIPEKAEELTDLNTILAEIGLSMQEIRNLLSAEEYKEVEGYFEEIDENLDAILHAWIASNSE
jgi:endonuclease III-like uncharacterized protein